jgi:spermidine synthase
MWLYAVTIFLGSFLLFQIQPMIAKMILPWFGGTSAVWVTCMLFFQLGLLAGYTYAHASIRYLQPKTQTLVHGVLLVLSLFLLPIGPSLAWKAAGHDFPILQICVLLTISIGLPYFLLSASSSLMQAWYAGRSNSALPYKLFALSNLASLTGLLAYPFVIEPVFTLREQSAAWSIAYGIFSAFAMAAAAINARKGTPQGLARQPLAQTAEGSGDAPSIHDKTWWFCLSACGVVLFLSVNNHLTQNITSIPFLWILPLAIYLLSFVLCFDIEGLYRRSWYLVPLAAVLYGAMARVVWIDGATTSDLQLTLPFFACVLLAACMFCHGELAHRKPSPGHLTAFYLIISAGGAFGGLLISVAAPTLFRGYFEMPLALLACAALVTAVHVRRGWMAGTASVVLTLGIVVMTGYYVQGYAEGAVALDRNFYGWLRVKDVLKGDGSNFRYLLHGAIIHGGQFTDANRCDRPTAYYGMSTGVAAAIRSLNDRPIRAGIIGLGSGILAAYSRPGDVYRFYEINPMVEKFARDYFTFLSAAQGKVEIVLGDARISLEREEVQNYDLLVVDAFSGDAIPVHLLTQQAIEIYFRHLKPGGILAMQISNNHFDLEPVVEKVARSCGKYAVLLENEHSTAEEVYAAKWVLVTAAPLQMRALRLAPKPLPARSDLGVWTDDYNNMVQILKW